MLVDGDNWVMRLLPIRWQRLVDPEGQTCVRCAATQGEVEHAVAMLEQVLAPLNMTPQLEVSEVDNATFQASPRSLVSAQKRHT